MKKTNIMSQIHGSRSSVNGSPIASNGMAIQVDLPKGPEYVVITHPADIKRVEALLPLVEQGDVDALREFVEIVERYDYLVAALIVMYGIGDEGSGLLMLGEHFEDDPDVDDEMAFDGYRLSADAGNICGMCHLGRCYAEGKGCGKDKSLAKRWLSKAAPECPDAKQYLDSI